MNKNVISVMVILLILFVSASAVQAQKHAAIQAPGVDFLFQPAQGRISEQRGQTRQRREFERFAQALADRGASVWINGRDEAALRDAAARIGADPERYGFQAVEADTLRYDTIEVDDTFSLDQVARAGGFALRTLTDLPVYGVIEPGVEAALRATAGRVTVITTEARLGSTATRYSVFCSVTSPAWLCATSGWMA